MLDLDALEALLEKATKCEQDARIDCKDFENAKETMADTLRQDIAKSVPSLIAELRELREDEALHVSVIGDLMAETTKLKAEIEKLREATHWRPIAKIAPLTDEQADLLIAALTDPPEGA